MESNIRERIDRGVATDAWLQLFPTYSLRHLPHSFSDHCSLLIETEVVGMGKSPRGFVSKRVGRARLSTKEVEMLILTRRLEEFNCSERPEETLAELVDVKLHLNMEIDKEEIYWEQGARVN
ncbi:hypothetical protein EPI10_015431 [Gossypium australe]|uniref:Reverse transcriptase n=1 Tax=Gossypium australe TaxID=47621 RepID=A0A5B6VKW2_9ROSI|nr:hypothetical protein EPI10_015431 [Gossypium australe]